MRTRIFFCSCLIYLSFIISKLWLIVMIFPIFNIPCALFAFYSPLPFLDSRFFIRHVVRLLERVPYSIIIVCNGLEQKGDYARPLKKWSPTCLENILRYNNVTLCFKGRNLMSFFISEKEKLSELYTKLKWEYFRSIMFV